MRKSCDYSIALASTPRGGFIISGDAYINFNYQHYLVETDSLGTLRRQRTILPFGPAITNGYRYNNGCNVLVLPNAQGYLLSGTADSIPLGQFPPGKQIGYLMRLDTALNVTWVYRHPPALSGTGATQNLAYRARFLPNNSVGLLLTEVRAAGTPDAFLVQLDIATGQRRAMYVLSSNTQRVIIPYDWQWVGDGTLFIAGKSNQLGVNATQGYLARWDFSRTPLAARTADEATAMATFTLSPNPSTGPVTIEWQLPPAPGSCGCIRGWASWSKPCRCRPRPAAGWRWPGCPPASTWPGWWMRPARRRAGRSGCWCGSRAKSFCKNENGSPDVGARHSGCSNVLPRHRGLCF